MAGAWAAMMAALLLGCGPAKSGAEDGGATAHQSVAEPDKNVLTFTYHRHSGDNYIDQQLFIRNTDRDSVTPVLAFTALDRHGHRLPGVQVRTVYGSDSGRLVVPYGWGFDILRFSGPGKHQVYDVRVAVTHLATARVRANIHPVTTQPLNAAGQTASKFSRFTAVRVTNPDAFEVSVRVAYLVYDQPAKGETQQAISVTPVGGLVRVPAHGTGVVKVTGGAVQAVARYSGGPAVSVKAYNSQ
ncbi:hypothetical protein J2Z21_008802 [Streptomyces griseochromogenes]|uniref:Lipoprotein n=1 Tax=Streptomyces griseochromogenes TaxID=68214 RepID=A0A1B1AZ07_9ACTN|nr:hypothetical protein [Streptomyces griseochromogenes]ANP51752.1 hypothetical protein AVL59_21100 [Streptomyces griseochromogenes]MBP2055786.1 hypothetical protein [Streptomyces griseochromogenes]